MDVLILEQDFCAIKVCVQKSKKVSQYNVVSICKFIPLSYSLYLTVNEIRLNIKEKNSAALKYRVKNSLWPHITKLIQAT